MSKTAKSAPAIPPELEDALNASATARKRFDALAPSHQNEYVRWIVEGLKPETRVTRARKTIDMLLE